MALNAHVYPSPLTNESRIVRITDALLSHGIFDEVVVVGVNNGQQPLSEQAGTRRTLVRLPRRLMQKGSGFLAKLAGTLEWSIRVLRFLLARKFNCINAHSLAVLPVCALASKLTGAKLIYDTHEIETETHGSTGLRKRLGVWVERALIKRCDKVFVVGDAIADWYAAAYNIPRPAVVRNVPRGNTQQAGPGSNTTNLRAILGISPEDVLFLYQGGFVKGRGIERLIEVFERLPASRHIVFMGYGALQAQIERAAALHPNIHRLPAVPPGEVLQYTRSADIGICATEDSCLSHRLSLPNKLFEYLHAGIPPLVNPLPEQQRIIKQYQCGWIMPADDQQLVQLLAAISPQDIHQRRAKVPQAAAAFQWENEERVIVESYRDLNHA